MDDLSISRQYDVQLTLLLKYYEIYNDNEKLDAMSVDEVAKLVTNIHDTEVILDFLEENGVRGTMGSRRDVINIDRFGNKYQTYGLTGSEEAAVERKRARSKNNKAPKRRKLAADRMKF